MNNTSQSDQSPKDDPKIITLEEARKKGLRRYYTGKPCKHGHLSERQTSDRACIECKKIRLQANRKNVKNAVLRGIRPPTTEELSSLPHSRKSAIESGSNFYFTNKPCHNGHVAYRLTASGSCSQCEHERITSEEGREYQRQHYAENAETKKQKSSDYYYLNWDSRKKARRSYYRRNRAALSMQTKIRKRGLSSQYNKLPSEVKMEIKQIYEKRDLMNKEAGEILFHVDHIIPVSKGGKHHPSNLRIITAFENLSKKDKLLDPELDNDNT